MERADGEGRRRGSRRRLALFPCPLEGHLNPMLQLATLLHSRGFSITIIHTYFNSPNASDYPDFSFRPIFDGHLDGRAATEDLMGLIADLNVNCEAGFNEQVDRMVEEEPHNPVVCIVSDALMHFTQSAAKRLRLPRIILRTSSITSLVTCAAFPILREKGYLPVQDPESDALVSVLPPLRIKDLPNIGTDKLDNLYQLVTNMISETKSSVAVISNSFDSLEPTALSKVRQDFSVPIFPIGPLHKYPTPTPSPSSPTLLTHDMTCMPWLGYHPPTSVVYASLGSLAVMSQGELVEMAWGLANCGQPFLWAIRPSSVQGGAKLPEGFEAETAGRGKVVTWAPQTEVLAHPAVSVFLTHCGWNSTLESICEGVPMLCWPRFGDQKVNARFVSHVWGVGVQLEEGLDRVKIERGINRLMVGKEGEEMRVRARALKENAELCIRERGSSYESLHKLIDCVSSL